MSETKIAYPTHDENPAPTTNDVPFLPLPYDAQRDGIEVIISGKDPRSYVSSSVDKKYMPDYCSFTPSTSLEPTKYGMSVVFGGLASVDPFDTEAAVPDIIEDLFKSEFPTYDKSSGLKRHLATPYLAVLNHHMRLNSRVLVLGAGDGQDIYRIAKSVKDSTYANVEVDAWEEHPSDKVRENGYVRSFRSGISIRGRDLIGVPAADLGREIATRSYDLVVACFSFHYLVRDKSHHFWSVIKSRLRKNAKIIGYYPSAEGYMNVYRGYKGARFPDPSKDISLLSLTGSGNERRMVTSTLGAIYGEPAITDSEVFNTFRSVGLDAHVMHARAVGRSVPVSNSLMQKMDALYELRGFNICVVKNDVPVAAYENRFSSFNGIPFDKVDWEHSQFAIRASPNHGKLAGTDDINYLMKSGPYLISKKTDGVSAVCQVVSNKLYLKMPNRTYGIGSFNAPDCSFQVEVVRELDLIDRDCSKVFKPTLLKDNIIKKKTKSVRFFVPQVGDESEVVDVDADNPSDCTHGDRIGGIVDVNDQYVFSNIRPQADDTYRLYFIEMLEFKGEAINHFLYGYNIAYHYRFDNNSGFSRLFYKEISNDFEEVLASDLAMPYDGFVIQRTSGSAPKNPNALGSALYLKEYPTLDVKIVNPITDDLFRWTTNFQDLIANGVICSHSDEVSGRIFETDLSGNVIRMRTDKEEPNTEYQRKIAQAALTYQDAKRFLEYNKLSKSLPFCVFDLNDGLFPRFYHDVRTNYQRWTREFAKCVVLTYPCGVSFKNPKVTKNFLTGRKFYHNIVLPTTFESMAIKNGLPDWFPFFKFFGEEDERF